MIYLLAKKLLDEGFPQPTTGAVLVNPDNEDEAITAPSVSDIITACGKHFISLDKHEGIDSWSTESVGGKVIHCPEDDTVLAYLWLDLRSKKVI